MKKVGIIFLICSVLLGVSSCKPKDIPKRESVSECPVATFEYRNDDGYKLITSEIDSLDTFDGLCLKTSESAFSGEWIYRIVFNPSEYVKNTEEVVILFGEENLSINGTVYVGDNVAYTELLNWASAKYEFFDYELIKKSSIDGESD